MKEKELLLLRLVELMFEKQQTFLLIDELYEDEIVGTFIRNIQIDSPYQQLLFEGVLSQFLQRGELVVNITVENYFHHLLGLILQKDDRYQRSESLIQLVQSNNLKGLKEGVSNLLSFDVELGDFNRITQLIDLSEGDKDILEICVKPSLNALLIHGVEKIVEVILENPTENDWKALFKLDTRLKDLQLHLLRKDFLKEVIPSNPLNSKFNVWLGLLAISIFDKELAKNYMLKIDTSVNFIQEDEDLLSQLALCEDTFGNYDSALEYYEKSLAIRIKKLGAEHPDVSSSYSNIARVLDSKGEYDKAIEFYKKCLDIELKTIGTENPDVATSYNNIGGVLDTKGEYDSALEYYEKCIDIQLKTLGTEHSDFAVTYGNIGLVWKNIGEYDRALEYYEKCIEIELKTLGSEHRIVATSYNNIARVFYLINEYDSALEYYEKSLAILLKTLGSEHPYLASSYHNIGQVWDSKGNFDKAKENYEKGLEISLKTIEEDYSSVAAIYNNIGAFWQSKREFDKALEYYEKCIEIELKNLGTEHPDVADSYNNIGEVWESKGKYEKALEYFEKSLELKLINILENPFSMANSYFNIGDTLKNLNQYSYAIENFKKGYEIEKSGGYPFKIAQCYEALNNKENALDYYIQSAKIRKEDPEVGLEAESTQEAISNALRLAKELDKENELPEWMS